MQQFVTAYVTSSEDLHDLVMTIANELTHIIGSTNIYGGCVHMQKKVNSVLVPMGFNSC